ncbi:hypothetical protein ACVGXP_04220, partial [Enterobacter hormaechei]
GNVVVHGVDTRVLPGDAGGCRGDENPIVCPVIVTATPQNRSNGVSHPRRQARYREQDRLLNARITLSVSYKNFPSQHKDKLMLYAVFWMKKCGGGGGGGG